MRGQVMQCIEYTQKGNAGGYGTGNRKGHAVLSAELVAPIRARYVLRCRINGARALGRELGVSDTTIRDALKQRTWKEN